MPNLRSLMFLTTAFSQLPTLPVKFELLHISSAYVVLGSVTYSIQ